MTPRAYQTRPLATVQGGAGPPAPERDPAGRLRYSLSQQAPRRSCHRSTGRKTLRQRRRTPTAGSSLTRGRPVPRPTGAFAALEARPARRLSKRSTPLLTLPRLPARQALT